MLVVLCMFIKLLSKHHHICFPAQFDASTPQLPSLTPMLRCTVIQIKRREWEREPTRGGRQVDHDHVWLKVQQLKDKLKWEYFYYRYSTVPDIYILIYNCRSTGTIWELRLETIFINIPKILNKWQPCNIPFLNPSVCSF